MNTEVNKISMLNVAPFDFSSFDRLRMNGINQSFLSVSTYKTSVTSVVKK